MKCELFFRDLAKIPQDWRDSRAQQEGRVGAICLLAVGQRELVYAHSLSGNCECTEVQKQLISQLSSTLESKSIHIRERGLTSTTWSEYSEKAVKRVQYSSSPTSSIPPKR